MFKLCFICVCVVWLCEDVCSFVVGMVVDCLVELFCLFNGFDVNILLWVG